MFGISQTTWQFINTFAPWFSAAGTFSAVIVSLWLATSQRRARLRVLVGHFTMVEQGRQPPFPEFVMIQAVNIGSRPVRVTNLAWRVGTLKHRFAMQTVGDPLSSRLPVEVEQGQEASWFLRTDGEWAENLSKSLLMPNWRRALETLRFEIYTSLGHTSRAVPNVDLREIIASTCRRLEHVASC